MRNVLVAMLLAVTPALADEPVLLPYEGSFDDATFAVESAIVGQGLVIDYVSHVGDMLARTRVDVGGEAEIFEAANIYLFCSAVLSREVMVIDPSNIQHCPYGIFVTEKDGQVQIGHRTYPEGPMQKVETLLREIAAEAAAF